MTFYNQDKISLSAVKNNYVCAHYFSAELSILLVFMSICFKQCSEIKHDSWESFKHRRFKFISLDTPLRIPSGLQSLATLGKLYESEGGFSKIVNSQEYKEKRKLKKKNERIIEKASEIF